MKKAFYYAFRGIGNAIQSERNMKIHLFVMILVILAGIFFQINFLEWMLCLMMFLLVIAGEMFNTAIETVVDMAMPEKNELAKKAKDIAAGAVLVLALGAVIVGGIIFFPKVVSLF